MMYRVFFMAALMTSALSGAENPRFFDTAARGGPSSEGTVQAPWKTIALEPDYAGMWVVAGDLDGDKEVEWVGCENYNEKDTHYTSAVAVQKIDGSVLWRWGRPDLGRKKWHHDVACQIHDWDGDGRLEVVVAARDAVVSLDGATGRELRRFAIPEGAADCITFCNVSGGNAPRDIIVKNRYTRLYCYNQEGRELWSMRMPGEARTAHQPLPVDVDQDGRTEILAGYALLNPDGSVRWTYQSKQVDLARGHMDCARVLQAGNTPEEFRIALTCCGANAITLLNGRGKVLWERQGQHFESIDIGRMIPGMTEPQITVDIDHVENEGPVWVLGADGAFLGRITTDYSRHHALADWNGDGLDDMIIAHNRSVFDGQGRCIAVLQGPPSPPIDKYETSVITGDFNGDGSRDIALVSPDTVSVYANPAPHSGLALPLGTDFNFSLY